MKQSNLDFLLQTDFIDYIRHEIEKKPWLPVYQQYNNASESGYFHCALIPNTEVDKSLQTYRWDWFIGDGRPSCSIHHDGNNANIVYHRFGKSVGVEPFIYVREFHKIKPTYIEIGEEFRLFHNLYFDNKTNSYIKINRSGNEEKVIEIEEQTTRVNLKFIRQFLTAKQSHLAMFFQICRYSPIPVEEVDQALVMRALEVRESNLAYDFYIAECKWLEGFKSVSVLEGKKLISGLSVEECGIFPYENRDVKFVEFKIGVNEAGQEIVYSCAPQKLNNLFNSNPDAPSYFTPVSFQREVLNRYYEYPEKFLVGDGYLSCGSLWGLHIDNNLNDRVVVFLGDLGKELPYEEQLHWACFNILSEEGISETNFKRSFLVQATEPHQPDLRFKSRFRDFQEKWKKEYGWFLFKPLSREDEHYYISLRVPLIESQAEFDKQTLALSKTIADSINEEEIEKQISSLPKGAKGITKLEKFLTEHNYSRIDRGITFLRNLWDLRHGVGHRKGDEYRKASRFFYVEEKGFIKSFEEILIFAIQLLDNLETQIQKR